MDSPLSSAARAPETPRRIQNNSTRFPNVPMFADPYICPVHRCYHRRQGPIKKNYPQVEDYVRQQLEIEYNAAAARNENQQRSRRRRLILYAFISTMSDCGEADLDEAFLLAAIDDASCFATWEHRLEVTGAVGYLSLAFATVAHRIKQLSSHLLPPCLCDLTHIPSARLIESINSARDEIRNGTEIPPPLPPFDVPALLRTIESCIASGSLAGVFWTGDWRSKVSKVLEFIRLPLESMLLEEVRIDFQGMRALFRVVSVSRLYEEMIHAWEAVQWEGFESEGACPWPPISNAFEKAMTLPSVGSSAVVESLFRSGNLSEAQADTDTALSYYNLASLMDPSHWLSHLNAAAIRLRCSDSLLQTVQYSRAIYDCTNVLKFAGRNFKAFYRQGIALTLFGEWEHAILDFEQALLMEPKNPLVLDRIAYCQEVASSEDLT